MLLWRSSGPNCVGYFSFWVTVMSFSMGVPDRNGSDVFLTDGIRGQSFGPEKIEKEKKKPLHQRVE